MDVAVLRSVLVLALGVLTARVAHADPEPIRIAYSAPAGCPSEAEVIARLEAQAEIRPVSDASARSFAFSIATGQVGDGFRGELAVTGGGTPAARVVTGGTCRETVAALVLVAALAVEERAPARPAEHAAVPWQLAFGAGFARYDGMTPSALYGVPLSLAASHGRAELRVAFDATTSDAGAMATFHWLAGRIEACPYVPRIGRFELAPCAGLQAGAVTSRGTAVGQASSDTRPWLAPELAGHVALRIGRVAVEVEATAAAPIVRDRYYIAPSTTVYQVPRVAFGVGAGLAVQLW